MKTFHFYCVDDRNRKFTIGWKKCSSVINANQLAMWLSEDYPWELFFN